MPRQPIPETAVPAAPSVPLGTPSAALRAGSADPGSMGWLCSGDGHRPDDMAGRGDLMERAEHDRSAQAAPASAGTLDAADQAPGQPAAGPGPAGAARMGRKGAESGGR